MKNERIVYHVHERLDVDTEQYEFKYAELESAVSLVQAFVPYTSVRVSVVLYNNGVNCTEVAHLGQLRGSKLTELIQDKIKLLDVINVAAL